MHTPPASILGDARRAESPRDRAALLEDGDTPGSLPAELPPTPGPRPVPPPMGSSRRGAPPLSPPPVPGGVRGPVSSDAVLIQYTSAVKGPHAIAEALSLSNPPWLQDMEKRPGAMLNTGLLLGVNTTLWRVKDGNGDVVSEASLETGAAAQKALLARHHGRAAERYSTEVAWDSDKARRLAAYQGVSSEAEVGERELLPEKRQLLSQVSGALQAFAIALREAHAYFVSDILLYVVMHSRGILERLERDPLTELQELFQLLEETPNGILHRALTRAHVPIILLLDARLLRYIDAIRQVFSFQAALAIDGFDHKWSPDLMVYPWTLVALASRRSSKGKAGGKSGLGAPEAPESTRPNAVALHCSGHRGSLCVARELALAGVPQVVLHHSGQCADVWYGSWHEHLDGRLDLRRQRLRLSVAFAEEATEADMADLRTVLDRGDLVVHALGDKASAGLGQIVKLFLGKDDVLQAAWQQLAALELAAGQHSLPQLVFGIMPMLLTFVVIILALVASQCPGSDPWLEETTTTLPPLPSGSPRVIVRYPELSRVDVALIVLPTLLWIFESADQHLKLADAARAAVRAVGLVEKEVYMYRVRALDFSDTALAHQAARDGEDVTVFRQRLLTDRVSSIVQSMIGIIPGLDMSTAPKTQQRRGPNLLGADDYASSSGRVGVALASCASAARVMRYVAACVRASLFVSTSVGIVLATTGNSRWVAVTVGLFMVTLTIMRHVRLEERCAANVSAVSDINSAWVKWKALPQEMRSRQDEIDRIVAVVENAIERTLPQPLPQAAAPPSTPARPPQPSSKGLAEAA